MRDQLQGLDQLTADQKMSLPDSTVSRDVVALAFDQRLAAVQLFQMRHVLSCKGQKEGFEPCRQAVARSSARLRARDDGVALVVEGRREDFVCVALEDLQAIAGLHVPHSAGSVAAPVVGILTVGSGCHGSAQRRLGDAQRRLGCRRERLLAVMILLPCGLNDTFEISPSWPMRIAWHAPVIVL